MATHEDALDLLRAEVPARLYRFAEILATDPELKAGILERAAAEVGAPGRHAEMLRDPRVSKVLHAIRASDSEALKDTRRNALIQLQVLCSHDPADAFTDDGLDFRNIRDMSPAIRSAITSIKRKPDGTVEVRFVNRLDALKLLFQHFGDLDSRTTALMGTATVHIHGRKKEDWE